MNRNDRRVAIAALVVGVLSLIGFWLVGGQGIAEDERLASSYIQRDTMHHQRASNSKTSYYAVEPRKVERFSFDPNTADSTQLLRLGLQPWQVKNIYKYRSRGGVYRCKEDFARLYGLTVKQYRELEPYIYISEDYQPASTLLGKYINDERPRRLDSLRERISYQRDTVLYPVKLKPGQYIDLNIADTSQLKKVPGIGSYYARKILQYGQWLGGYVNVNQLDEIENFPQDAKPYFVVSSPQPRKLAVNHLKLYQLRRHPYINYFQAKTIVEYRQQHGNITSLQQLSFSRDFTPEIIERLEPYVKYE